MFGGLNFLHNSFRTSAVVLLFRSFFFFRGGLMEPIVIQPSGGGQVKYSVIFLHGLGDTGHGWADVMKMIRNSNTRYICPTAPTMPVSLNFGMSMPSWFDIKGLSMNAEQDEEGVKRARDSLLRLVEKEEKNGIPSNRTIIGGFSQGGAVALYTALTSSKTFAGVVALSSWLPLHNKIKDQVQKHNQDTPFLQCHGMSDPLVNFDFGKSSGEFVKTFCKNHEFKGYRGLVHSSSEEELADVKNFIKSITSK